jgi:hypothetical protein
MLGLKKVTIHILRPKRSKRPAESSSTGLAEQAAVLLLVLSGISIWLWAIASAVASVFGAANIRTIATLE